MISESIIQDSIITPVESIECSECECVVDTASQSMFSTVECPNCGVPLRVPGTLGNLFVLKELGHGMAGSVYKAFDVNLQQHVALKVIRLGPNSAEKIEKFINKLKALDSENHRNLVRLIYCGQEKGQPFIVMEMIEGLGMNEFMGEGIQMDEVTLLQFILEAVYGLRAAYNRGILHGDIKPSNILIDTQQTAKVMDFGLAKTFQEKPNSPDAPPPYYISPERVRKYKEDFRSDIYSLGAMMFHALAGQPPFNAGNNSELMTVRLTEAAPPLQNFRKKVNKQTAEMVGRMLQMDPMKRYADYKSLLSDIHTALGAAMKGPKVITPSI